MREELVDKMQEHPPLRHRRRLIRRRRPAPNKKQVTRLHQPRLIVRLAIQLRRIQDPPHPRLGGIR